MSALLQFNSKLVPTATKQDKPKQRWLKCLLKYGGVDACYQARFHVCKAKDFVTWVKYTGFDAQTALLFQI